jgi:hypothetical protein
LVVRSDPGPTEALAYVMVRWFGRQAHPQKFTSRTSEVVLCPRLYLSFVKWFGRQDRAQELIPSTVVVVRCPRQFQILGPGFGRQAHPQKFTSRTSEVVRCPRISIFFQEKLRHLR